MRSPVLIWKRILSVAVIALVLSVAASPRLTAEEATLASAQAGGESTPAAHSPEKEKQEEDENDAYRHSATVKALGAKFGLDAEQAATAFTVANFVVLALLVGWFLLKALPKMFRARNEAIQKHLTDARRATEEASTRMGGVEARLAKLDEQIAALKAQAEKDAALEEQRIKASVEEEKRKILAAAEQEISVATEQARRQIQRYAADLAIEQAARKLVITPEADRVLVQDFARRLATEGAKGGHN
jgi:F-type H+-transporting ATPase subunit b